MKRITFIFMMTFYLFGLQTFIQGQTPFNRGVNLTGWFQTSNPRQIQFSKYTKKILRTLKVSVVMPFAFQSIYSP